jgi:apolipoprotein N-acyltransferase
MGQLARDSSQPVQPLLLQVLFALLSGLLLAIPYLSPHLYLLSWFAFVPFLYAIEQTSPTRSYVLGLILGMAFCICAGYWIVDFLMLSKGYDWIFSLGWGAIFWLYNAQLFALIAVVYRVLSRQSEDALLTHKSLSGYLLLLFPVVVVAAYSLFPMLFPFRLGDSQSRFLVVLQGIEYSGVYGLDFIIVLSNILLFRCLRIWQSRNEMHQKVKSRLLVSSLAAFGVIVVWFGYGLGAILVWDEKITHWQSTTIGIVQPNETPSLGKPLIYPGYSQSYPPELAMTERLARAGAKLVLWPEARYKGFFDQASVRQSYAASVSQWQTPVLFQDIQVVNDAIGVEEASKSEQYNTAVMLDETGAVSGQYRKMKRIAFGEYVPVVSDIPLLRGWLESFLGEFLNEMAAGTAQERFATEKVSLIPLICYETMFPEFVANAVSLDSTNSAGKTAAMLVGLSSNGWFGKTAQPFLHVNASILRAVENRLPLVHVVNNGPSVVVLPTGTISFISDYHQAGGYLAEVPHSVTAQGSFYSRHPYFFTTCVYLALFFMVVFCVRGKRRQSLGGHANS